LALAVEPDEDACLVCEREGDDCARCDTGEGGAADSGLAADEPGSACPTALRSVTAGATGCWGIPECKVVIGEADEALVEGATPAVTAGPCTGEPCSLRELCAVVDGCEGVGI
jgi:hypothetical protein